MTLGPLLDQPLPSAVRIFLETMLSWFYFQTVNWISATVLFWTSRVTILNTINPPIPNIYSILP